MSEGEACLLTDRNRGPGAISRPLRDGDVRTVKRLFEGLSERSRRLRFNGPKPQLSRSELEQLATVDAEHHAVVAYVDGEPIGIAQLVRTRSSAEIAFAVVDEYQRRGIGSALLSDLFARARTAGITEVTALVSSSNPGALALIRRLTRILAIQYEGSDVSVRAAIV
jgi:GNAT superfamily N-acetyltransferase